MAPIEPEVDNDNTTPLLYLGSYTMVLTSLVLFVSHRVFYRAYLALPPSAQTRQQQPHRAKQVTLIASLAGIAFFVSLYHVLSILLVSYQVFAFEHGLPIPDTFLPIPQADTLPAVPLRAFGTHTSHGIFSPTWDLTLLLQSWFRRTTPVTDAWEIALSSSRRSWWASQLLQARSAWSFYIAFDSRRRGIPHAWVFVALVPLVGLAFAQALYGVAVLLAPVGLSEEERHGDLVHSQSEGRTKGKKLSKSAQAATARAEHAAASLPRRVKNFVGLLLPERDANWAPSPAVSAIAALFTSTTNALLQFSTNTPSFKPFLLISTATLFLPLLLPTILPSRLGSSTPSSSSRSALSAFRTTALISLPLHLLRTIIAVVDNAEPRHKHWYFLREKRTLTDMLGGSLGRVLGAFSDHPAAGYVCWDVILAGVTWLIWSGLRGVDASTVLHAVGLSWRTSTNIVGAVEDAADTASNAAGAVKSKAKKVTAREEVPEESKSARKPRSRKAKEVVPEEVGETGEMAESYKASAGLEEWAGDEDRTEDWEAGALAWGLLVVGGLGVASTGVLGGDFGV